MDTRKSRAVIRIVDDDKGVRDSYKFLIEGEGWLVRTYSSAEDFLEHDDPTIQGCGVFDVRMPGISGLELQAKLAQRSTQLPVILVSAHGDIEMAVKAFGVPINACSCKRWIFFVNRLSMKNYWRPLTGLLRKVFPMLENRLKIASSSIDGIP